MAKEIERWRFKYIAKFGHYEAVELPNGLYDEEGQFVTDFSRYCAIYTATPEYISTIQGFNKTTDIVIAVNNQYQDIINPFFDGSSYVVNINNQEFKIVNVDVQVNQIVGVHLITLRKVDKLGR